MARIAARLLRESDCIINSDYSPHLQIAKNKPNKKKSKPQLRTSGIAKPEPVIAPVAVFPEVDLLPIGLGKK